MTEEANALHLIADALNNIAAALVLLGPGTPNDAIEDIPHIATSIASEDAR